VIVDYSSIIINYSSYNYLFMNSKKGDWNPEFNGASGM
jgi:hypothetical protein